MNRQSRSRPGLSVLTPFVVTGVVVLSLTLFALADSAEAAVTAKGSHVNDTDRDALVVAKDTDYTLTSKTQIIIYAAGVDTGGGDRIDDQHTWKFSSDGGLTFSDITTTSEVKLSATNALVHNATVSNANRRATEGDTETFIRAGKEFETANPLNMGDRVEDGDITETQIGLSFADALDNQQYEFAVEWDNDGTKVTVIYTAKITTPAVSVSITIIDWREVY